VCPEDAFEPEKAFDTYKKDDKKRIRAANSKKRVSPVW
jgi:hypothetical protein